VYQIIEVGNDVVVVGLVDGGRKLVVIVEIDK
jgi:hypothetical protein